MSVDHALTIQGWMSKAELRWLSEQAAGSQLVIEMGAWCGRSSVALSAAERVVCVDTWRGSPEHAETIAGGFAPLAQWQMATDRYPNLTGRVCDLSSPADVAALVDDYAGLADMVFVDAAHDYVSVCRDIVTARQLLAPGGLLCGHDLHPTWPDVRRAVEDCTPGFAVVPETTIWYVPCTR